MSFLLIAAIGETIFKVLLSLMAIFLILLVLVQRGRGGGLAGALGGMGGSSAFGAKAGDVFTRITIVAAAIWIVLCVFATRMVPQSESRIDTGLTGAPAQTSSGLAPGATGEAEKAEAAGEAAAEGDGAAAGAVEGAVEGKAAETGPEMPAASTDKAAEGAAGAGEGAEKAVEGEKGP